MDVRFIILGIVVVVVLAMVMVSFRLWLLGPLPASIIGFLIGRYLWPACPSPKG